MSCVAETVAAGYDVGGPNRRPEDRGVEIRRRRRTAPRVTVASLPPLGEASGQRCHELTGPGRQQQQQPLA